VDVNPEAVAAARARGHEVVQAAIGELPFGDESFDLIVCLDVLEHVADDSAALRELTRVTRPGGAMLLSVPAWPLLWSSHDEAAAHRRRYRRRDLTALASGAGWHLERDGYFNCLLLPIAALLRLADRARASRRARGSHLRLTPTWLDGPLELPLRAEAGLLRRGVRLPAGLSLIGVLRRPEWLR
jgi:SAM-dependent methyltransferase